MSKTNDKDMFMVLNDGETYTSADGCYVIIGIPDEVEDYLEGGEYEYEVIKTTETFEVDVFEVKIIEPEEEEDD